MTITRVALIGLGEVGAILAEDLRAAGVTDIAAYDLRFSDPDSPPSQTAKALDVRAARSGADAARGVDLIVSAVTAACDVEAAKSVVDGIERGAFFLDLNSASPGMKQASAVIVEAAGGRYVEAAVMTPYPPKRIASYMLLGGPHGAAFMDAAGGLGFAGKPFSDVVGQASATKMCRSVMIKGIEALITESMLAARHYGVEDTVLASLSDLLPIPSWPDLAQYMISRTLEHGVRRAEEMREAARTVEEAGVEPLMALATAVRQDWAATHKAALKAKTLPAMLDAIAMEKQPLPAEGERFKVAENQGDAPMADDAPAKPLTCPSCGHALDEGKAHGLHEYKDMKLKLDGYLGPGEKLHRNMLFDTLYASVPKDPQVHVQMYNYEIAPKGFTNWHIHTGATFYLTLQGRFEGHFQEGVLIEGKPGEVYSEPIGKPHRGHNPHDEVTLLGVGIAITSPGLDPIINIEPPAWAPK